MEANEWVEALDGGWIVLTANRRLARSVERRHDQIKTAAGETVWPTPEILPLSAWLETSWSALLDQSPPALTLLSEDQERVLWEKIVANSPQKGALLWSDSAAHDAQKTAEMLAAWRLSLPESVAEGDEDVLAFWQWSDQFERQCRENSWLSRGRLIEVLVENLEEIPLPKGVFLAGFNEITPIQQRLLDQLAQRGVPHRQWQDLPPTPCGYRVACPDIESEILAASQWSRRQIESRLKGAGERPGKGLTIGIVVPDLQRLRGQIIRLFSDTFYPGRPQQAPFPDQSLFNLSLGVSLSEFPMIHHGLKLLGWSLGSGEWQSSGALLSSPYWGGGESEWNQRALLDARLRQEGGLVFSLAELIEQGNLAHTPLLVKHLSAFQSGCLELEQGAKSQKRPGAWAKWFDKQLKQLGWPGERVLNSHEFQAMESWRKLLAAFSGLELVLGSVNLSEALYQLNQLAAQTIFQPVESEANIHILGVLEAEGEHFDALWILGLTDQVWPSIPQPTPFLPVFFQRQHNLPRSSSQREMRYAKALTQHLLSSANKIIVSYAERDGDLDQRPSPLITHLNSIDFSEISNHDPNLTQTLFIRGGMVERVDCPPPPFADSTSVSGGTGVIKAQSLCPFSAYARFRLLAQPLEEPSPGLNAGQRGEITHESLSLFWQRVVSSTQLKSLSVDQLDQLIEEVTRHSVLKVAARRGKRLHRNYLALEMARQKRLLIHWMAVELSRDTDFEVVERESTRSMEVGGLVIQFRMDRLDKLVGPEVGEEEQVVVDYKTGQVNLKHWFSERPQEPQMLLYGLSCGPHLAALVYGQLSRIKQRYVGLSHRQGIMASLDLLESGRYSPEHPDWPSLLHYWSQVITQLAQQYRQGEAAVDPLPNACDWCPFPLFCRLSERQAPLGSTPLIKEDYS
ncbi:MAG: PD-(D/E)XK nuclease family protein [Magnetococcales bacterium]|nr:PD-(D/E)XK nuclease family protein [Magnetococcales bacterium]